MCNSLTVQYLYATIEFTRSLAYFLYFIFLQRKMLHSSCFRRLASRLYLPHHSRLLLWSPSDPASTRRAFSDGEESGKTPNASLFNINNIIFPLSKTSGHILTAGPVPAFLRLWQRLVQGELVPRPHGARDEANAEGDRRGIRIGPFVYASFLNTF